jgi:hypothetical protein
MAQVGSRQYASTTNLHYLARSHLPALETADKPRYGSLYARMLGAAGKSVELI